MRFSKWTSVASTLVAALAITLQLPAQDSPGHKPKHHQYKLIDLGDFGGPGSETAVILPILNNSGATLGIAQTPAHDPYDPNCMSQYFAAFPDCLVAHAFGWRNGHLTDLGALPGANNSSYGYAINDAGVMDGLSETGAIDPQTGYPEVHAVVWQNGHITDLGTFGGAQSEPGGINNRGQVVGWAMNTTVDPFSAAFEGIGTNYGWTGTTQLRAFLWEDGLKRDLGTLGGPDAQAYAINQSGQIAGQSFTSYTPNPDTGIPTVDPFLWDHGTMTDLGNLGGDISWAVWLNDRGQVAGTSYVANDQYPHAFLWDRGKLTDLGTLGGNYSYALWLNNQGDVVGVAGLPGDEAFPAALWSHGKVTNLGTLSGDNLANANGINSAQQIVGLSCALPCNDRTEERAFLWENGGPMVDLNALVSPPSNLHVYDGIYINDSGELVAFALDPSGNIRAVVLVPQGNCAGDCEERIAETENATPAPQPATTGAAIPAFGRPGNWLANPLGQRNAGSGQRVAF